MLGSPTGSSAGLRAVTLLDTLGRISGATLSLLAVACSSAPQVTSSETASPARADDRGGPRTEYHVEIEVEPAGGAVHLRATLGPLAPGSIGPSGLVFSFPERFAFVTLPPRFTVKPTASAPDRAVPFPEQLGDFRFRVDPQGASELELTWSIALDHREQPEVIAGNDAYEHSFMEAGCGMLFTAELIPMPNVNLHGIEVTIPQDVGASTIAPWPSDTRKSGEPATWNPSAAELSDDILLVGPGWTTVMTEAAGLQATFALAPGNEWLRPIIEEQLVSIVQSEINLFGWSPREKFLFAFGPSGGTPGYGGSPKSGSMTLFVSNELPPKMARESVAHLIAHEFHHLWAHGTVEASDDLRFVGEGFTDYYAYIVPWRLGMISDATMHKTLESRLTAGAAALAKYGRSLTAAGGPEFFAGREAYDACYAAGLAMALWTDLALRKNGHGQGLDGFMREWYRKVPTGTGAPEARSVTIEDWKAQLSTRLPAHQVEHFSRVIAGTEPIDWEGLFDEVDLIVERVDASFQISPSCLPRLR